MEILLIHTAFFYIRFPNKIKCLTVTIFILLCLYLSA